MKLTPSWPGSLDGIKAEVGSGLLEIDEMVINARTMEFEIDKALGHEGIVYVDPANTKVRPCRVRGEVR